MCCAMAHMWRLEDGLLESVLSVDNVGSGCWTQVLRLHSRPLYTISHSVNPVHSFLLFFQLYFYVYGCCCLCVYLCAMCLVPLEAGRGNHGGLWTALKPGSSAGVSSALNQWATTAAAVHLLLLAFLYLAAHAMACALICLQAVEHAGCFLVLSFIGKTAIYICVQVFVQT